MTKGTLITGFFVVLAFFGLFFTKRLKLAETLKKHHDVSGFAYNIVGVIYAVLLGFTIITVQEKFNTASQATEREAGIISELYRDAEVFDPEVREEIRKSFLEYMDLVIKDEWEKMGQLQISESTIQTVRKIWKLYYSIEPQNPRQQIWLAESIRKLNEFSATRLERLYEGYDTLNPMVWTLLLFGGVIVVFFIYLFHFEDTRLHLLITCLVAGLVTFMIFLVGELDQAYTGSMKVNPTAIQKVKEIIETWK